MVVTFTPYKQEEEEVKFKPYNPEEQIKFKPYVEPPKFEAYVPEPAKTEPLTTEVSEQKFIPFFQPYDMAPNQIRDMAKIMGTTAEAPKEPVMGLEYIPAKVYSYLVEEPLSNALSLVSKGLEKGFRFLGMDKIADNQVKVTKIYEAPPVTEKVKEQTAYNRESAYKEGQGLGIMFDISEAGTRLGALLVQMGVLQKVPALKGGEITKRFSTLAAHGFLTSEGDIKDRLEAGVYRAAYSMTPFIAQHWGATGIKSIALDTALNTMLTSPVYVKAYNNAKETGDWGGFVSQVIPQFVMDIGMALSTTGYPEAQMKAKLKSMYKLTAKSMDIPYKDFESIVKSFNEAQNPKTPFQKQALEKQEAKLQSLMEKDNANIEIEKLAVDEKFSPINKLIEQAKTDPTPDIQEKINKVAMELSTNPQKARVHIMAKELGLLTSKDNEKGVYKAFLKSLVGEDSTKNMNQGQIKMVIDNLDNMAPATAKALSKTKIKNIDPDLLSWIPAIREIGAIAKFRNPYEVFNAMGLLRKVYLPAEGAEINLMNDLAEYRLQINKMIKQKGITKESYTKVFDAIENPEGKIELNPAEIKLRDFAKIFFDDWANKLKLPPEKRRDKYVTHIFEEALNDMTKKGYIDPEILRAFEFGAIPKEIKNPFIKEERTGREYGLKRNVIEAMNVYEAYALRTFHYEPLLKKIDTYNKFLPEQSRKYLGNYVGRMTNRPVDIDKAINNDIRAVANAIAKSPLAKAPIFNKILPMFQDVSKGNIAGTAAYYYTGLLYETAMGMRPISAIRNLGQGTLTICESGLGNYIKGLGFLATKDGIDALHKSKVYQSRKYTYLPSQGGYIAQGALGKTKNAMMYMFREADKFNVSSAFATGYQEAKSLGLPDPICIERGDEVARKTQYMYTKMASPEFNISVPGKILGVFTSWPRNWLELTNHWLRGDTSEVYQNYEKLTGKKVINENWVNRHRAAMTYAVIYALSMYVEQNTDIRATEYTGWSTIKSLPGWFSGQLAGLRLPLAISQIAVGAALNDDTMLKTGIKGVNPTNWFNVLKELDDIANGKKDWLDFYFYRNRKREFRLK